MPANGAQDVDPNLMEMVITFDRPMVDGSWAIVVGGPRFPELPGKPRYDETHKVLTVPIKLKPSWSHELWVNRGEFQAFMGANGKRLDSVVVTFRVRAK